MDQQAYEKNMKSLLGERERQKVDWNSISKLLSGQEGKAILQSLAGNGGDALKRSAENALKGDKDAANRLVSSLLSTREGTDLVQKIAKLIKK